MMTLKRVNHALLRAFLLEMTSMYESKFKLKNVGRYNFNTEVVVAHQHKDDYIKGLEDSVSGYLLSREIDLCQFGDESMVWTIFVGGFRPVGEVEAIYLNAIREEHNDNKIREQDQGPS